MNIHVPGMPTLLILAILVMLEVRDPGIVYELIWSPPLNPASASIAPSPSSPKELSPVVHCRSAYRNITNDSSSLVASIH